MNTTCGFCGAAFRAQRKTAKFCSDRCRIRAHRGEAVPLASAWLRSAATVLAQEVFTPAGLSVDPTSFDISFGFPLQDQRPRRDSKGQLSRKGGATFLSTGIAWITIPAQDDPLEVLSILAHEMIHAAVPEPGRGHGKLFQKACDAIGLLPPYEATRPGETLKGKLKTVLDTVGPMPFRTDYRRRRNERAFVERDGVFLLAELPPEPYAPPRRKYRRPIRGGASPSRS